MATREPIVHHFWRKRQATVGGGGRTSTSGASLAPRSRSRKPTWVAAAHKPASAMPRNSVTRWRPPSPSPDSARYRRRPNPVSLSDMEAGYSTALLDWLGCATAGLDEPAALAARAAGDPVLALGAAGHVLDFDDP